MSMAVGLACGLAVAPIAAAGTGLTLVDADAWDGPGLGGPFEVSYDGPGDHPGAGNFGVASDDHFITFCMEYREYIEEGGTYDVQISDRTKGRYGEDPLDTRTAFLYTSFVEGTLDDAFADWAGDSDFTFDYLDPTSGEAMQEAIWTIEGDSGFAAMTPEFSADLIAFADDAVAEGGAWYGMGIGRVRVLNLTENGESRQDMLTFVPLPAPVLLGVIGLGFGTLAGRRRRGVTSP